jgi:hypothetical protein
MRILAATAALTLALSASTAPAQVWVGGSYVGPGVGVYLGGPWYWAPPYAYPPPAAFYPYGYPYGWGAPGYRYPALAAGPPAYIEKPASAPADRWYYCQDPPGYFPYVTRCNQPWMDVVPDAARSGGARP